ncbi:hypothetical protein PVK06_012609 [Gossypium arboreum]|uniref:Uncharacterized protein n=1 Tax=Gossypium arboreum TaxID=29729 RepID=A0ABR0QCU0_GOSAR|nr:hypothetical protein PVK06_012609 [Gossypium arboreum]
MITERNLSAGLEEKEHLTKYVDKCYNNSVYYQIQAGIDLITKAQNLLQQKTCRFWIDGRKIMTYDTGNNHDDMNKESIQLLKKIAEIEIDDFPSYIIEDTKST